MGDEAINILYNSPNILDMINYQTQDTILAFTTERWDAIPEDVILPVQTHSCHVAVVREPMADYPDTDALVTDRVGVMIGIRTADCVPVLLYDTIRGVVAAVHAGWRGTVGGITGKTIEVMQTELGCCPKDIHAIIGPSISPEAFEVGNEVVEQFVRAGFPEEIICKFSLPLAKRFGEGAFHIDLWRANEWLLTEAGVPAGQIEVSGLCTYTNRDRFFSARQEGIGTGRLVSGIVRKR